MADVATALQLVYYVTQLALVQPSDGPPQFAGQFVGPAYDSKAACVAFARQVNATVPALRDAFCVEVKLDETGRIVDRRFLPESVMDCGCPTPARRRAQ